MSNSSISCYPMIAGIAMPQPALKPMDIMLNKALRKEIAGIAMPQPALKLTEFSFSVQNTTIAGIAMPQPALKQSNS